MKNIKEIIRGDNSVSFEFANKEFTGSISFIEDVFVFDKTIMDRHGNIVVGGIGVATHNDIAGRDVADTHPLTSITGLVASGAGTLFLSDDGTYKDVSPSSIYMLNSVYDPTHQNTDVFNMDNMSEGNTSKILDVSERIKLSGIEEGAEVNVQVDWEEIDNSSDAFILNKPRHNDILGRADSQAHPSTSISIVDFGGFYPSTDVEGALRELGKVGANKVISVSSLWDETVNDTPPISQHIKLSNTGVLYISTVGYESNTDFTEVLKTVGEEFIIILKGTSSKTANKVLKVTNKDVFPLGYKYNVNIVDSQGDFIDLEVVNLSIFPYYNATLLEVDSTGFVGNLSISDDTVYKALNTIDSLDLGTSGALQVINNLSDLADITSARMNLHLDNIDNTSDHDKPISLATQTALDIKLETVATDASITGDGTSSNPLHVVEGSTGDMTKAVYDPSSIEADAFSMGSMVETTAAKILTVTERSTIVANASKNSYPLADAVKLAGIEEEAEKNVQSNWHTTDSSLDSFILNKPVTITSTQRSDILENNSKRTYPLADETKVATIEDNADVTDAVNVAAAGAVMVTGDVSISGIKTFTVGPLVPTPISSTQAVNKGYVDDAIGNVGGIPTTLEWEFDSSTVDSDPGAGKWRLGGTTFMYVNTSRTSNGTDLSALLSAINKGANIYIQDAEDDTKSISITVSDDVVTATGYVKIPIVIVDSPATAFVAGDITGFTILNVGGSGGASERAIVSSTAWDGTAKIVDLTTSNQITYTINDLVESIEFTLAFPTDASVVSRDVIIRADNSINTKAISTITFTGNWEWAIGDPVTGIAAGAVVELVVRNISGDTVKAYTDTES